MFKTPKVQICNGVACTKAGTQGFVHEWLLEYFNENEIGTCSCLGLCHDNFSVLYKGKAYSVFTKKTFKRIID
ncbi:MAG: hypothetical protein DRI95_03780 [Bacteroidetes bacterium]|nr:MAG: hypothetical protein DRI95_03780 [Bacteroidota bacterium]RLD85939.1 MAG: hypothetical protein DRJ07_02000 [Bacteroidota bacterium]